MPSFKPSTNHAPLAPFFHSRHNFFFQYIPLGGGASPIETAHTTRTEASKRGDTLTESFAGYWRPSFMRLAMTLIRDAAAGSLIRFYYSRRRRRLRRHRRPLRVCHCHRGWRHPMSRKLRNIKALFGSSSSSAGHFGEGTSPDSLGLSTSVGPHGSIRPPRS